MFGDYGIPPNEMVKSSIRRSAVDTCLAGNIHYIGTEASGIIDIAATTGDITFKHGDLSSEAADTTVNANGAVPGTINLSSEAATFALLQGLIDLNPNWEFIPKAARPEDATEASGTAKILNNVTGGDADTVEGYALLFDTSAVLFHTIGVTSQGPESEVHGSDANVYHELTLLLASSTFASGTSVINVYSVSDKDNTSELIYSLAAGATTVEVKFPTDGDPIPFLNTKGKRIIVRIVNSAAMTAADLTVYFGTYKFGPAVRKSKLFSEC